MMCRGEGISACPYVGRNAWKKVGSGPPFIDVAVVCNDTLRPKTRTSRAGRMHALLAEKRKRGSSWITVVRVNTT